MHQTHNTLSENIRTQSVAALNRHLAAAIDLHGQIKQAHWNVRGPTFIAIHKLFDDVADTALEASDLLAERTAALGGTAEGTVQVATAKSFLVPYELGVADEAKHVFAVSAALAAFGQSIRDAAGVSTTQGDTTTADLFTEISRGIDLKLWFVEAHRVPA
jgi:starvation-inducible DNA-binding protein